MILDIGFSRASVSNQYDPFVYQFDRSTGGRSRALNVSAKLSITAPHSHGATDISGNTRGRFSNHGPEGLAIISVGGTLSASCTTRWRRGGARNGLSIRMLVVASGSGWRDTRRSGLTNVDECGLLGFESKAFTPRLVSLGAPIAFDNAFEASAFS